MSAPKSASILRGLARRHRSLLRRARVLRVAERNGRQILQVTSRSGAARDGVEQFQDYGFASRPHANAEAVVCLLSGADDHPIVVAVADRRYRLQGLMDGEVALYDDLGQAVKLTRAGIIIETAQSMTLQASAIDMVADGAVSITGSSVAISASQIDLDAPNVTAAGGVTASGPVAAPTVALAGLSYTGPAGAPLTLDASFVVTQELTIGGIPFSSHAHPETDDVTGPPQ